MPLRGRCVKAFLGLNYAQARSGAQSGSLRPRGGKTRGKAACPNLIGFNRLDARFRRLSGGRKGAGILADDGA